MTEPVAPLPEPIEHTDRHDLYINRRFNAIFEHEDNADVARMFTVGLAIEDAPKPVEEGTAASQEARAAAAETVIYKDADGDVITLGYVEQECPEHGVERVVGIAINSEQAVAIPAHHLGPIIAFLQARARGQK